MVAGPTGAEDAAAVNRQPAKKAVKVGRKKRAVIGGFLSEGVLAVNTRTVSRGPHQKQWQSAKAPLLD
jgi:hypothetical protein